MVKSKDLRLVWEVHKPDISQRNDVTSKALNLCTEKKMSAPKAFTYATK